MTYRIQPRKILYALLILSGILTMMGVVALANWHLEGIRNKYTILLVSFFDLSSDTSIPTWWSSGILFLAAIFAGVIAHLEWQKQQWLKYHWIVLAAVFVLLSIDEVACIHETLGERLVSDVVTETSGFFHYSWVIAGLAFVTIFGLAYIPFLRALPVRTSLLFIASGALFVGGAVGVEVFNGWYSETHGSWNLGYALGTALEEFLEMAGVSLFIYALAAHLALMCGGAATIKVVIASGLEDRRNQSTDS